MSDSTGSRIGDYLLGESLGDGAQGQVRAASWDGSGPPPPHARLSLALKIVRTAEFGPGTQGRYRKQVDSLRRMDHPALLRYFDAFDFHTGEWDEASCMVMERLEGETLAQRLEREGAPLSLEESRRVFLACLDGLAHAESLRILHRDLKPSNVFLCRDGGVKLIDFEIARQEEGSQAASTAGWKGTFDYMAPDYLRVPNFHGSIHSEMFSLGVCLYRTLCGTLPWPTFGPSAQVEYVNRWKEAEPAEFDASPAPLQVVVGALSFFKRALDPEPSRRFATYADMRAALEKWRFQRIECPGKPAYTLVEYLGRGGFGAVYRARREDDGRSVAIKRLFSDEHSKRFIKEATLLRDARHPCLVEYIDLLECAPPGQKPQLFLVMEHLPGMPAWTLKDRIQAAKHGLPPEEALLLFRRYAEGLHALHGRSVVHRDIKPGNLYAPADHPENAKIFDLGVARDVAGTQTMGQIPGTLEYMAPEFAAGGTERGTAQSDLFALAMSLHETLTGQGPFERLSTGGSEAWMRFFERAAGPMVPDLKGPLFEAYPGLRAFFRKALDKEPARRHADALAFLSELSAALGKPVKDLRKLRQAAAAVPASRPLGAGARLAATVGLGLVVAGVFLLVQRAKNPVATAIPPPPAAVVPAPLPAPVATPLPAPVPVDPTPPDPRLALRAEATQRAGQLRAAVGGLATPEAFAETIRAVEALATTEAGRAAPEEVLDLRTRIERKLSTLARDASTRAVQAGELGDGETAGKELQALQAWAAVVPEGWDREPLDFLFRQSSNTVARARMARAMPTTTPAPEPLPAPVPPAAPATFPLPEAVEPPISVAWRSAGTTEWNPVTGSAAQVPAGRVEFRLERADYETLLLTVEARAGETHPEVAVARGQPGSGLQVLQRALALESGGQARELDAILATAPTLAAPAHQAAWRALADRRRTTVRRAARTEALARFAPATQAWSAGDEVEAEAHYAAAAMALAADTDPDVAALAALARAGADLVALARTEDTTTRAGPALTSLTAATAGLHTVQRPTAERVRAALENYLKHARKRELTQMRMMEKVLIKETRALLPLQPADASSPGDRP